MNFFIFTRNSHKVPGKILLFILSFVMFLGVFYPLKGEETPFVQQDDIAIEFPFIIIQHIPFSIEIEITDPELAAAMEGDDLRLKIGDEYEDVRILNGYCHLHRPGKNGNILFM